MTLSVDVECDERCFDLPHWPELLSRDPDCHIFATPQWNRLWWEEFGQGKDLFLLTVRRGDELVAIVPLYRKIEDGKKVLRFMGGIDLTDYLGPICSLEDRDDVAETLVEWLAETFVEWDEFDAHNMPVPFGFAEFLVERADHRGLDVALEQEETSAILTLPGDWDTYLESLEAKERRELRRKRRRLVREVPDASFRSATEETLDADLKIFVDLHREAEGHKGHFMKPEIASFFERVARAFMPLGWLRLDFLQVAERPVAATFGFELGRTFYLYNSAYEPDVARLSPGVILAARLVEHAIEKGLKTFDFLRGPERYKYQLGAQAVPLNNVRIARAPEVTA
ncbi:MAG: GNAT family N-acetyltransferase [Actinomycetota bacterium]|nr:GNAT family N-acetyltransferase [Actinomycetota bacterium]